ncbi:LOW QUALITY PROTEIN: tuliposide A-converting enzyme 2, chloroplastic-like [Phoenix dactylifera]|uniref:LOW QUALITY PROTEIN: tuliposide A-converting enzyme 2, chloroplastic-like n=1 Tax=Phoenix dactylifera TaxID=42345 RepID=A0A8B7CPD6_PHODC|nr:LOW QUALITY PROTEIN: tuliposide A-converting enzyme 2, chloroplastic-like [Phoenix dactylifera]
MDPDTEVQLDLAPFFRIYKSGRLERLVGTDVVPASVDPATGVTSKDVTIDPSTGVSARLYLPTTTNKTKLPVLIYIHGGGFVIETAFSPTYHNYLNSLVSQAQILAVSVDYRRVPEHPLPAAYDDVLAAAKWVASHAAGSGGPEPWLSEHGDLNRVFLAGDSAGANIAHNVTLRAGKTESGSGMRIKGLLLVHPFFWGSKPVGSESTDPEPRRRTEELWGFACPGTTGADDPWINPLAEGGPGLEGLPCERVLVTVAEKDFIRERGRAYYEGLKGSGWGGEAELLESEGMGHVFHLLDPTSEKAVAKMERVVAFLNCA